MPYYDPVKGEFYEIGSFGNRIPSPGTETQVRLGNLVIAPDNKVVSPETLHKAPYVDPFAQYRGKPGETSNTGNTGYTGPGSSGPTTSSGGTLTPDAPYDYDSRYGGKPRVPDPGGSSDKAIDANKRNLPDATDLAERVNAFNYDQVKKQYELGIPGYSAMVEQSSKNIADALRGDVDYDFLQQSAAEYGINSGLPGSDFLDVALLNQTLKEKQARQAYGEQALTGAVGRMPKTPIYDPSQMFITPEQQQAAQLYANLIAAAPTPKDAYENALKLAQAGQATGMMGSRAPTRISTGNYNPNLTRMPVTVPNTRPSYVPQPTPAPSPDQTKKPGYIDVGSRSSGNVFDPYPNVPPHIELNGKPYYGDYKFSGIDTSLSIPPGSVWSDIPGTITDLGMDEDWFNYEFDWWNS